MKHHFQSPIQMEQGYSLPTEREIRIGMDYEYRSFSNWTKKSIKDLEDIVLVFNALKRGRIRVKDIDEQSIIDEGWTKEGDKFIKNNFSLTFSEGRLEIFYKENRVFAGICKTLNMFRSICILVRI